MRNLSEQHTKVISGEIGSAVQTLRELRRLIHWLAEGTKEMRGAFVGQDDASAAILCGLKSIQDTEFTFPTRPDGAFSPFDFSEPIPGDGDDPSAVLAMLDAGDDSEIYALAEYWHNLSSSLNDTVDALVRARTQLEENTGEAIDAAASCCTQVMATAQIFADNATAMHASVFPTASYSAGRSRPDRGHRSRAHRSGRRSHQPRRSTGSRGSSTGSHP
ncbi:hypothetical protein [Corynebacterium parakroppenstedtii]|uniref:hypothetical protein n=1 Tax=Corynebacterium parakroppenstedtii TaxID=2828363 RepID=UPI0030EBCF5D